MKAKREAMSLERRGGPRGTWKVSLMGTGGGWKVLGKNSEKPRLVFCFLIRDSRLDGRIDDLLTRKVGGGQGFGEAAKEIRHSVSGWGVETVWRLR